MAATGIGNSAGFVPVLDGGMPRIYPGVAKETISGGVFVFASGADNVVSSGTNSFVTSDIQYAKDASGGQFNGVCMQTAGSNAGISILTQGAVIAVANGTVTAGYPVKCDGNNSVANVAAVSGANVANVVTATVIQPIGRALTSAASGGHCIVDIRA